MCLICFCRINIYKQSLTVKHKGHRTLTFFKKQCMFIDATNFDAGLKTDKIPLNISFSVYYCLYLWFKGILFICVSKIAKTHIICVYYCISCTTYNGIVLCTNITSLYVDKNHNKINPNNFNSSTTLMTKINHQLLNLNLMCYKYE